MFYKVDVSKNISDGERKFFKKMKGECMVPFIILVVNSCSERYKHNNFYTFEYGAEYGAE